MMHAEANIRNESKNEKHPNASKCFGKLGMVYGINSSTKCGQEACQKSMPERSQRWLNRL